MILARGIRSAVLVALLLSGCTAVNPDISTNEQTRIDPRRVPIEPLPLRGSFSCTAYTQAGLPAINWPEIPFRWEGGRLTGLHIFKDSFGHQDSVVFNGTSGAAAARVMVTAVRADGSSNFTADMVGSPGLMTGQMMLGTSRRAVRLCTLALKAAR
jgi:hypothetical protein